MPPVKSDTSKATDPAFRRAVHACFEDERRAIAARWLYDHAGSQLFEDITDLPEYYPTRTETALLKAHCREVAQQVGTGGAIVEFGSGSSVKTPHLLRAVEPECYVPIDISGDFLRESAAIVARDFPEIDVAPVEGDFTKQLALPDRIETMRTLGFFPGSTIGNMVTRTSVDWLRNARAMLGEGSFLLIGMDRIKSLDVLLPAYDDAAGVTGAFNLNLLTRINAEMDGTIPEDSFVHEARWNDMYSRVEMHICATKDTEFTIEGRTYSMAKGDSIHTENSHKYGPRDARLLLRAGGWTPVGEWTDDKDWFALILAEAKPYHDAP